MLTKPAAVFLQLVGVVVAFLALGAESWVMGGVGIGLVVWGGAAARKHQQAAGARK